MEDTRIESLDDADLEHVSGGHGIGSFLHKGGGCDSHGHGLAVVGKVLDVASHVLEGVGHLLGKLSYHKHC